MRDASGLCATKVLQANTTHIIDNVMYVTDVDGFQRYYEENGMFPALSHDLQVRVFGYDELHARYMELSNFMKLGGPCVDGARVISGSKLLSLIKLDCSKLHAYDSKLPEGWEYHAVSVANTFFFLK